MYIVNHAFCTHIYIGKFDAARDKQARLFIDRDATHFRHILNWLRDGGLSWTAESSGLQPHELKQLSVEANYYRLNGLVEAIDKAAAHKSDGKDDNEAYIFVSAHSKASFDLPKAFNAIIKFKSLGFRQIKSTPAADYMFSVVLHSKSPKSGWKEQFDSLKKQYDFCHLTKCLRSY